MGLASVGVTATDVNVALKPVGRRGRPDRAAQEVPIERRRYGEGIRSGRL
jgi:hypothetical protein